MNTNDIWAKNLRDAASDVYRLAAAYEAAKEAGQFRFLRRIECQIESARCRVRNARKALMDGVANETQTPGPSPQKDAA